jgi:hypothetical protein
LDLLCEDPLCEDPFYDDVERHNTRKLSLLRLVYDYRSVVANAATRNEDSQGESSVDEESYNSRSIQNLTIVSAASMLTNERRRHAADARSTNRRTGERNLTNTMSKCRKVVVVVAGATGDFVIRASGICMMYLVYFGIHFVTDLVLGNCIYLLDVYAHPLSHQVGQVSFGLLDHHCHSSKSHVYTLYYISVVMTS